MAAPIPEMNNVRSLDRNEGAAPRCGSGGSGENLERSSSEVAILVVSRA